MKTTPDIIEVSRIRKHDVKLGEFSLAHRKTLTRLVREYGIRRVRLLRVAATVFVRGLDKHKAAYLVDGLCCPVGIERRFGRTTFEQYLHSVFTDTDHGTP